MWQGIKRQKVVDVGRETNLPKRSCANVFKGLQLRYDNYYAGLSRCLEMQSLRGIDTEVLKALTLMLKYKCGGAGEAVEEGIVAPAPVVPEGPEVWVWRKTGVEEAGDAKEEEEGELEALVPAVGERG